MIDPAGEREKSADERILPLINIIFLLLIFLMLAGVFAQRPPFALDPPATHRTGDHTRLATRVLSIDGQGRLALAGRRISRDRLADALADWPADTPLQIRADSGLASGDLAAVLAVLRRAGIGEVNLLTRHIGR